VVAVIRVDALWLCVQTLDMRAGVQTLLAQVIAVFGEARLHHAYLFANRRGTRMKVLVHDGYGLWLAQRQLLQGDFIGMRAPPGKLARRSAPGPESSAQLAA